MLGKEGKWQWRDWPQAEWSEWYRIVAARQASGKLTGGEGV